MVGHASSAARASAVGVIALADHAAHNAGRSQVPRELSRVNVFENRDVRRLRATKRGRRRRASSNSCATARARRHRRPAAVADSGILVVDAVVPDHRRRHHDDLAAIRRIGEHLLIAGHVRGEHDFGDGQAAASRNERAAKKGSILEEEEPWPACQAVRSRRATSSSAASVAGRLGRAGSIGTTGLRRRSHGRGRRACGARRLSSTDVGARPRVDINCSRKARPRKRPPAPPARSSSGGCPPDACR